jgi:hypothetical protein
MLAKSIASSARSAVRVRWLWQVTQYLVMVAACGETGAGGAAGRDCEPGLATARSTTAHVAPAARRVLLTMRVGAILAPVGRA